MENIAAFMILLSWWSNDDHQLHNSIIHGFDDKITCEAKLPHDLMKFRSQFGHADAWCLPVPVKPKTAQ